MDCCEFIGNLPPEWMQVMTILAHSLAAYPHQRVKMWWQLSGKQLRWTEFLYFLTQLEPLLNEGELVFQPRFYHLPDFLQKHTLQFIYQHCDDIDLTNFQQFLHSLFKECYIKVGWIELYLNLLQNRLICRQMEDNGLTAETERKCDKFHTSLATEFKFSEKNQPRLQNLCERLRVAGDCGPAQNVGGLFSGSSEIGEEELRQPGLSASGTRQLNNFGEGVIKECIDLQHEVTDVLLEKSVAVNDLAEMESVMVGDHEMPGCVVDYEIQTTVLKLRESWFGDQTVDPEIVILLKDLPPKQLEIVLEQMDAMNLPDASILLACQTLVECASQQISYNNVMHFASLFLLPQILKLGQAASRLFAAAVASFVKAFPLHSIEGLLKPLLVSSSCSCGVPQLELVIKIIREAFSSQHQQVLLRVLLDTEVRTWSDQMIVVLQSIIDTKVDLPSDHLRHLLSSLEYCSVANSANRKFGKLLLSYVQVYGHMLMPAELRQCSQMADSHKTFLSKSIKYTLSKLSTDAVTFQ